MTKSQNVSTVRTTETTFQIVDSLIELKGGQLYEIAEYLDIAPSTALRHLKTLKKHGYVTQTDGQYEIGSKFLTVGSTMRNSKLGYQLAETYVEDLVADTNERAQFIIEENGERIFLFRRIDRNPVRTKSNIGKRGPMHSSAGGKAILAEFPDEKIDSIIETHGLPSQTEHTITERDELFENIAQIRKQKFATNEEESAIGFHAVAAAVTDQNGDVLGAFSVSGPSHRLNTERMEGKVSKILLGAAQELRLKLEYSEK